jgi:GNAT superfamily N-acetyltransferase
MADIVIERATLAVAKDIVDVMELAYRGEESLKGWTSEAHLIDGPRTNLAEITGCITDDHTEILIAKNDEGELIGCAAVKLEGDHCVFGKFAVDPGKQGLGIGKLLLDASEQVALRDFGVTQMLMTVVDGRAELEAFYERRGYRRTGEQVPMHDLLSGQPLTKGSDLILNEFAKTLDR